MKLPARYLCVRRLGSKRFELIGCTDFPLQHFGLRSSAVFWDADELRWLEAKPGRGGSRRLVYAKANRPQYGEVPYSDGRADGPERFLPGEDYKRTAAEMVQKYAESGDTFTDFDRGLHREQVRDALILGLTVPPAVLAEFPNLDPSR